MAERENDLKQLVCSRAQVLGARLIRVAPAARWAEHPIQPPAFWPQYQIPPHSPGHGRRHLSGWLPQSE